MIAGKLADPWFKVFRKVDLFKVALHEFGHHLGIPDDYGRYGSIMRFGSIEFPQVDASGAYMRPELQFDDIKNAQKLYGCRSKVECYENDP